MRNNNRAIRPLITFCLVLPLLLFISLAQAAQIEKLLEQAEKGSAKSQTELGFVYELWKGVPEDPQKAATWYRKAAEQGYAQAQTNLGSFYESGVSGSEIVLDRATGLIWQKGYETNKTWLEALATCEESSHGGQTDWRLPNFFELMSLANPGRTAPASDFPGSATEEIWSSTSNPNYVAKAFRLDFRSGYGYYNPLKSTALDARCVRGGP